MTLAWSGGRCPGVQMPVPCLINTAGHCTWCGRPMPRAGRPDTPERREFWHRERQGESLRNLGTDPLEAIDSGDVGDYWLTA